MYAFKQDGSWVEFTNQKLPLLDEEVDGEPIEGLYHVPAGWSDEDKALRFGLFKVIETPTPEGKRVAAWALEDDDGKPRKVDELDDLPVEPEPVPAEISRRQFYEGLVLTGRITWDECFAALGSGVLPAFVEAALSAVLDEQMKNKARSRLIAAGSFFINDPFVHIFAALENMDLDEVAEFWLLCWDQ